MRRVKLAKFVLAILWLVASLYIVESLFYLIDLDITWAGHSSQEATSIVLVIGYAIYSIWDVIMGKEIM